MKNIDVDRNTKLLLHTRKEEPKWLYKGNQKSGLQTSIVDVIITMHTPMKLKEITQKDKILKY